MLTSLELQTANNWRKPKETKKNVDESTERKEPAKNSVSFPGR